MFSWTYTSSPGDRREFARAASRSPGWGYSRVTTRTERVRMAALDRGARDELIEQMFRLFSETCAGFTRPQFERLFLGDLEQAFDLEYNAEGRLRGFRVARGSALRAPLDVG